MAFKQKIPDCRSTHNPFDSSTMFVDKITELETKHGKEIVLSSVSVADMQQELPSPDVFNIDNSIRSGKNLMQVNSKVLSLSPEKMLSHSSEIIEKLEETKPLND